MDAQLAEQPDFAVMAEYQYRLSEEFAKCANIPAFNGGAAILAQLTQIQEGVNGLNTRMGGIETRMGGLEMRMGGLETRMDGLEARMGGLETRIGGIETRIGGLEVRMGGLETEVRSSIGAM
jgi:hypothetical protein